MVRNKYPEETVARILDAALELFAKQGYEHTSIQDIVDHLDGLTKGAIYHHFKSKEEIFDAAVNRVLAPTFGCIAANRDARHLTGAQKVARLFSPETVIPQAELWNRLAPDPDPIKNARLLGMEYRDSFAESAERYVLPIIEEGVADGSIVCEHPRETAEALSLLANLWLLPLFRSKGTTGDMLNRIDVFANMARAVGLEFDRVLMAETVQGLETVYCGEDRE